MSGDDRQQERAHPPRFVMGVAEPEAPPEAGPGVAEPARARRFGFARELLETALLTLVIFFAVRTLVVNYRVDGSSMLPSLENGQYLFVNKAIYFHFDRRALTNLLPGEDTPGEDIVYLFHRPERGDIVILDPPLPSAEPLVKRVIALPGERVAVREGKVYVNGVPLDEEYIAAPPNYAYPPPSGDAEFTVPPGTVFVLGDNRNNSRDSHVFGAAPLDNVIGKAIVTYWPLADLGLIPHERYANAGDGR